jgi:hypothetical protein
MKILNFFDFILENYKKIEVPFQFCQEFDYVLREIDSPISKAFQNLRLKHCDISLINIGEEIDTATFTTSLKLSQHFKTEDEKQLTTYIQPLSRNTEIYSKYRTTIKIGRLIRKLFGSQFSDSEIEKFVNQYKSSLDSKVLNFEIWEGYKILDGYRSKNYTYDGASSNPLMNSCMNDELSLIDFYQYVPVKLLVLLNNENHIFGRALIWKTDKGLFMDRVYTAFDSDYYKFIEYAKKNDIIYKEENRSGCLIKYVKSGNVSWFPMKVNLKFNIEEYNRDEFDEQSKDIPYMDTFIYSQKNNLLNFEPTDGRYYVLTDTDGQPLEVVTQYDINGQRIETDQIENYEWSNTQNGWIHNLSGTYVNSVQDFLSYDYLKDSDNGFIFSEKSGWIKNEK